MVPSWRCPPGTRLKAPSACSSASRSSKMQCSVTGQVRRNTGPCLTCRWRSENVVVLQTLEGYFRSHPPNRERIAQIQQLIASEHWPTNQQQKPLTVRRVAAEVALQGLQHDHVF